MLLPGARGSRSRSRVRTVETEGTIESMLFRKGLGKRSRGLRLYFCSDIHGSEKCFRKFLRAGDFYKVDHLILGGDMTGKSIVPILKTSNGYTCTYLEHEYRDLDSSGLAELRELIRGHGAYATIGTADE